MSCILGIDFGTTNTTAAYLPSENSNLQQILYKGGLFSSAVKFSNSGKPSACPNMDNMHLRDAAINAKRLIGRSYHNSFIKTIRDKCGLPLCEMGECIDAYKDSCIHEIGYVLPNQEKISAVSVCTEIFKKVKQVAEAQSGLEFSDAVVTVPVQYTWEQRQETYRAVENAGFKVRCLQYEPVMAAYYYCKRKKINQGKFLIYDFGGGTFDAAVVSVRDGIFRIEETRGDTKLGGDDITNSILDSLLQLRRMYKENLSSEEATPEDKFRLKKYAEQLKKSAQKVEEIELDLYEFFGIPNRKVKFFLLSNQIREIIKTTIDMAICLDQIHNVDYVLMIGGSSSFFYCKQMMTEHFGDRLVRDIDVNFCVSQGAALCTRELQVENAVLQIRNQLQCALGFYTMSHGIRYFCKEGDYLPQQYNESVILKNGGQRLITIITESQNQEEMPRKTELIVKLGKNYPPETKFVLRFAVKNDLLFYITVIEEGGAIAAPTQKVMLH